MVVAGRLPDYPPKLLEYEIVANQADGKYSVSGSYDTENMVCTFATPKIELNSLLNFLLS